MPKKEFETWQLVAGKLIAVLVCFCGVAGLFVLLIKLLKQLKVLVG